MASLTGVRAMKIALRKAVTPLGLAGNGTSAGRFGWLRQERISALFRGERVSLRDPTPGAARSMRTAGEPLQ